MKFGVARYGPSAPSTFQFGKYDAFTSTGSPTRSTWNEIESSSACTVGDLDRIVDRRRGVVQRGRRRRRGASRRVPSATIGWSSCSGNHHHGTGDLLLPAVGVGRDAVGHDRLVREALDERRVGDP